MVRKFVLWMSTVLLCPLWANAQYTTSYQWGVQDITSYIKTGTNAWFLLPGGGHCLTNSLSVGNDSIPRCISSGDGYAYYWSSGAWTKVTSMGTGLKGLAAEDSAHVWSLQASSWCTNLAEGYQVFLWSGTAWVAEQGCLVQFGVGSDGTILGVDSDQELWQSADGGSTWQQVGANTGWTFASVGDALTYCAVKNEQLYQLVSGAMALMSPQPPGILVGCAIATDGTLLTWNSTNGVAYFLNGAWSSIAGSVESIVTSGKTNTLALGITGQPYHLNVTPLSIVGSIVGSLNGCPVPGEPCAPGVTHSASIQVKFPHGINGSIGSDSGSPTTLLSATSQDYSPLCDPFYGNPTSDPECQASAPADEVVCSATGENLTGGAAIPKFQLHLATTRFLTDPSEDVVLSPTRTRYYMQQTWCENTQFPDFTPADLPGPPPQSYTFQPYRTGFDLSLLMMNINGTGWVPLPSAKPIYQGDFLEPQNQIPLASHCTLNGQ